ncbi:MAG: putative Ig domain-containing protein, partial [Jatrophihabitantaceae bacterium]
NASNGGSLPVSVTNSMFTGNTTSGGNGGGVVNVFGGSVSVTNSTFTGNTTSGEGTIGGDPANLRTGGGVNNNVRSGGSVSVSSSTFTGNTVSGGVSFGGGIFNVGSVSVVASTFTGNTAAGGGSSGAIFSINGSVSVAGSVLAGNSPNCNSAYGGTLTDAGYNIADDASCDLTATGSVNSQSGLAATLGSLGDHGGPTLTRVPKAGSPVLAAIPDPTSVTVAGANVELCPRVDQRGVASIGACTVGAVEVPTKKPQTISFTSTPPSPSWIGDTYSPVASATSTLAATFAIDASSTAGACSLSTGTVSFTGAGLCVVDADQAGDATYRAADQVQQSITVTMRTPPALINATPPTTAVVGTQYDYTFVATGSPAPTFLVGSGTLPPGLVLDSVSGMLSGSPTTAGQFTFTVSADNGADTAATSSAITITVNAALTITTRALPDGMIGRHYVATLTTSGGDGGPDVWTLAPGSVLPTGLTLSHDGAITGTPTTAGLSSFTVSVNDPITAVFTITVLPVAATPPTTTLAQTGTLAETGTPVDPITFTELALLLLLSGAVTLVAARRKRDQR